MSDNNKQTPRKEPDGPTTGMLHRRPKEECPLCPIWGIPWDENDPQTWDKQHVHAEELWKCWNPSDKHGRWISDVIETAAEMNVEVTPKQVKDHFSDRHRIEQPMMSGQLNYEMLLEAVNSFDDIGRQVIDSVYRQHVLMTKQIIEVFYTRGKTSSNAARQAAVHDLSMLAQGHFLYRYYPSEEDCDMRNTPPQFSKAALWYLGKAAIPYVREQYNLNFYPPYINRFKDVKKETMIHDIRANNIFVSICAELNKSKGKINYADQDLLIEANPANWYGPGPQALNMAFFDKLSGHEKRIMPDGFASLSIHRGGGKIPNCQLPFFYEYDHGSRDTKDVAQQLVNYHLLAHAQTVGKRFPDLNIDSYQTPVIMVFSNPAKLERVRNSFQDMAQEQLNINYGTPIFLVSEENWEHNPLRAIVQSAWAEQQEKTFLEQLIISSNSLLESRALEAEQILRLDNKAGAITAGTENLNKNKKGEKTKFWDEQIEKQNNPTHQAESDLTQENNKQEASPEIDDTRIEREKQTEETINQVEEPVNSAKNQSHQETKETTDNTSKTISPVEQYDNAKNDIDIQQQAADLALKIIATKDYLLSLEKEHEQMLNNIVEVPFVTPATPEENKDSAHIDFPAKKEEPILNRPDEPVEVDSEPETDDSEPETDDEPEALPDPLDPFFEAGDHESIPESSEPPAVNKAFPEQSDESIETTIEQEQEYKPAWEELQEEPPPVVENNEPTKSSKSVFPALEDEFDWEQPDQYAELEPPAQPEPEPPAQPEPVPPAQPEPEPPAQPEPEPPAQPEPEPPAQPEPVIENKDPLFQDNLYDLEDAPQTAPVDEPLDDFEFDEDALPPNSPFRSKSSANDKQMHIVGSSSEEQKAEDDKKYQQALTTEPENQSTSPSTEDNSDIEHKLSNAAAQRRRRRSSR